MIPLSSYLSGSLTVFVICQNQNWHQNQFQGKVCFICAFEIGFMNLEKPTSMLLSLAKPDVSRNKNVTNTHPFNGPFSWTTRVSWYQKGKTNLDFTEARDSEWQWHQLGHMQVCISLQTDNHASTQPLTFLQAGCPSCRPTNNDLSVLI